VAFPLPVRLGIGLGIGFAIAELGRFLRNRVVPIETEKLQRTDAGYWGLVAVGPVLTLVYFYTRAQPALGRSPGRESLAGGRGRRGKKDPAPEACGDCFEAAGKYMMDQKMRGADEGLVLVHGEVTGQGPIEGLKYGHAWVEDGDWVIDKSNGQDLRLPKEIYYALGRVGKVHRYDYRKFARKVTDTGHWGPWDLKTLRGLSRSLQ
jgi:hypothetical protein